MINPVRLIRNILQLPLAILIAAGTSLVELFDFIINHINTPLANMVDTVCLDLLPDLGQHAVMLVGSTLHPFLSNIYIIGIGASVSAFESLLMFCAQGFYPVFAGIVTAVIPSLSFAVPYLFMGAGGLAILNQLVCLKKIFKAVNTATIDTENNNDIVNDKFEIMRGRPIESGLKILKQLLNRFVTFPDFTNEAYEMACVMKDQIASVLGFSRRTEPLVIELQDVKNIVVAGLGVGEPLEAIDPQLTQGIEDEAKNEAKDDTKNIQPLIFSGAEKSDSYVPDAEHDIENYMPKNIERRHSFPAMT